MKVLLISQPNTHKIKPYFPPVGIAYLGAVSFNDGHETLLIDAGLSNISDIVKKAKRFAPDFIGITCWTIGRDTVWKLCAVLKKELPKTFLCIGGSHASTFPGHIFIKTHASAVVIGEGEETFRELLKVLDAKGDLKSVKGLVLRNNNNTAYFTGQRRYIENLDSIPMPFYKGFERFKFSSYAEFVPLLPPTAHIMSSRGCVFKCTFCSSVKFWENRWRYRSAGNVIQEIEWLIKEMGAKSIFFFDDNFTVNRKRLIDICEGITGLKLNIKWACCSHVKMVDKDSLDVMKRSGCERIDFGVESGSDKILQNTKKNQTRADIEKTFTMVHAAGIKPRAYLMVGNAGENEETIDQTIETIGNIKPDASIGAGLVWFLPGTSAYDEAVKNGYINDDVWLKSDRTIYNLQEHSYKELCKLRWRLMSGIARKKGGIAPRIICYVKNIFYNYPFLSFLRSLVRSLIPDKLK